jgi:hypothetical protein
MSWSVESPTRIREPRRGDYAALAFAQQSPR